MSGEGDSWPAHPPGPGPGPGPGALPYLPPPAPPPRPYQTPYTSYSYPYSYQHPNPNEVDYSYSSQMYPSENTYSDYNSSGGYFPTPDMSTHMEPSMYQENDGAYANEIPFVDVSIPPPLVPYADNSTYILPPPIALDVTRPPPIIPSSHGYNRQTSSTMAVDGSLCGYDRSSKRDSKADESYSRSKSQYSRDGYSGRTNEKYSDSKSSDRYHRGYSPRRDDRGRSSSSRYADRDKYDKGYDSKHGKCSPRRRSHEKSRSASREQSREQSSRGESKGHTSSRSSSRSRRSYSPKRKPSDEYPRRSESKSSKTPKESAPMKSTDDEHSTRKNISNTIEKACENPETSEDKSDDDEPLLKRWYRSSPAELYYVAVDGKRGVVESTARGLKLADTVREKLIDRGKNSRPTPGTEPVLPPRTHRPKLCKHKSEHVSSSDSSSGSENDEADHAMQELERKQQHPRRLHPEMWYNDPGEMNDGPLCRCSARTRRQGIRHGVYAAESSPPPCDIYSNNADKLYHYRITISPPTNFLIKTLTVISHDEHEFLFSGFSLLSHYPLTKLPTCKVIRFNIEYTILYIEEQAPVNYTIEELDLFEEFLFREILELVDLDMGQRTENGCSQFHLLPRWERALGGGGGEVLAMAEVLRHLIRSGGLLLPDSSLPALRAASQREWQSFVDGVRGMIVTYPGKKPCSVRVDQLDRSLSDDIKPREELNNENDESDLIYPEIVHFGIRPPQLSYAGSPEYKKAWRDYVKFRHLVANMAKPSYEDKRKLESKEARLQEMRTQSKMKRDVTVALSAKGFYRTGIMCDVVQHAMLIPVLISHLRFHNSLNILEKTINYKFENRSLLQLALTHPSYRDNFGTNPDHARNSLTNCGIRQPEYGDRRIHYMNIRKRGIFI